MDGFLFMTSLVFSVAGLAFFFMLTRHRERTQMIEKGADASLFQSEPRKRNYFIAMLIGIVFICLSLGVGFGFALENVLITSGWIKYGGHPGPYFFSIFMMIGVGFILAFFLHKKMINKE